jgi:hypothetical protein
MAKPLWPNVSNVQYRSERIEPLAGRQREGSRER